ncbi:MAG: bifunctional diguanylate cyclase/phosphodiesterase, partial [Sphingobium sp.]
LWIDLDRFKEINDSLGHMIGDALLRAVVDRFSSTLDGRGHLARFGGDEFVIICPEMDRASAQTIAQEIIAIFQHGIEVGAHNLPVTASVGLAVGPQDGRDSDELMQHADLALYQAKQSGRNQAISFTWSMKERFHRIHEIETGLRRALENDELTLHFQPIFELSTGRIALCEALLRWDNPALGAVSPAEFIPIAESIGVIEQITEWVLQRACEAAADWPDDVRIAVNISSSLLKSGDLAANVVAALLHTGVSARRLELEVTESIFLEDNAHTTQILRDLQRIGLRLVLDDFGTGYSSLSYLRSYHFDGIKIDRSFMAGIEASREDQAIVRAVGYLAADLGMEIVAEGIETEGQLQYARNAGIHNVQGYLMCKAESRLLVTDMITRGVTIGDAIAVRSRRRVATRA